MIPNWDALRAADEIAATDDLDLQTVADHQALIRKHDNVLAKRRPILKRYDNLLEGEMPLKYMAPEIQEEFGDRIAQLVINLAQLGVESYENRLDIDGIRLDPNADADNAESQAFADMDMDFVSQQVHYEALGLGISYAMVGTASDNETPVVTPESPFEVTTQLDPLRVTRSAVKRWKAEDEKTNMRSLMLPNETQHWAMQRGKWMILPGDEGRDEHGLGRVPVFTFLNRGRLLRDIGRPVFKPVIPLYEALNKMATDMMVSGEAHANGQRYLGGVDPDAFEDEEGNQVSPLKALIGSVWTIPGSNGKEPLQIGQFSASDLSNFHNSIKLLLQVGGHLMGLPVAYTSFATDNPAAEGAIKAGEIQLIKGALRNHTGFGSPWRRCWQTVMRIRDGAYTEEAKHLQIMWRDPSTPTIAQMADAVTKLVSTTDKQGRGVVPVEIAREMLGFSSQMRDAMSAADQRALQAGTAAIRDAFAAPEFSDAP